ncbi:unnamed protein product [Chondrus crispus]|uniref:Uncharacterized protein n=1 Tax=Chondrus crispus TaxID=2769 RepID=R7QN14_CHOCR|nr:unnamed protein product [Chondrus crispus]CDF38775.1 unnamed protein product [Chondrus crispus]|eukprot:XP_005718680.1 unnamed protein product [Chondrus crispus]
MRASRAGREPCPPSYTLHPYIFNNNSAGAPREQRRLDIFSRLFTFGTRARLLPNNPLEVRHVLPPRESALWQAALVCRVRTCFTICLRTAVSLLLPLPGTSLSSARHAASGEREASVALLASLMAARKLSRVRPDTPRRGRERPHPPLSCHHSSIHTSATRFLQTSCLRYRHQNKNPPILEKSSPLYPPPDDTLRIHMYRNVRSHCAPTPYASTLPTPDSCSDSVASSPSSTVTVDSRFFLLNRGNRLLLVLFVDLQDSAIETSLLLLAPCSESLESSLRTAPLAMPKNLSAFFNAPP